MQIEPLVLLDFEQNISYIWIQCTVLQLNTRYPLSAYIVSL